MKPSPTARIFQSPPLRDITAFDFYSNVQRPLEELQAASATGDSAKATKAEAQLVEGLDEFAKISPKFQAYVKGLEDRIAKSEKRLDNLESIVARIFTDMRAFRVYDGPSEVHRWSMAKRIARG